MARSKSLHWSAQPAAGVGGAAKTFVWKGWTKFTHAFSLRAKASAPLKERSASKRCLFCKTGQLQTACVSMTTRWGETACLVTGVPADVCMDCGRYTLAPPVVLRVQDLLVEDTRATTAGGVAKLAFRRRRVRVDLRGSLQGHLGLRSDVRVVNLSPDGALVEHAVLLSRGETCILSLRLHRVDLTVRARVVWSRVHNPGKGAAGAGALPFRSGFQFPDLPEAAKDQIGQYLAALGTANGDVNNGGK